MCVFSGFRIQKTIYHMKTDFNQIQSIRSIRGPPFIVLFLRIYKRFDNKQKMLGFWYLLLEE